MSSSLRPAAMRFITSCSRALDLKSFSAFTRYISFWPARLGASGAVAMPWAPWHTAHCMDLARPASISALQDGTARPASPRARKTEAGLMLLPFIRYAINGAHHVIRDQHGAVRQKRDVDGATEVLVLVA